MVSLKYEKFRFYWAVVTKKKRLNSVYANVSYLWAGILNEILAFSPSLKVRIIPMNS